VCVGEGHALRGEAIEVWGRDLAALGVEAMHIPVSKIIGENINHMRLGGGRCAKRQHRSQEQGGDDQKGVFHGGVSELRPLAQMDPTRASGLSRAGIHRSGNWFQPGLPEKVVRGSQGQTALPEEGAAAHEQREAHR
jgi:hypothetical protein